MENIIKIIYDKSINNSYLNLYDIKKILELLVIEKDLNNYILDIDIQHIRSNNLASYSSYSKIVTIYVNQIYEMLNDIQKDILIFDNISIMLYKNLSILQTLLHEVEHANQQKLAYYENSLESFIIRLSYLVSNSCEDILYEYCPEERLAEIKSLEEIIKMVDYIEKNFFDLRTILDTEKLKRLLRGYHYRNSSVNIPIVDYFTMGNKKHLLDVIDLSKNNQTKYTLNERFKYGFPISIDEYEISMKKLILSLDKNFKNRIEVKL